MHWTKTTCLAAALLAAGAPPALAAVLDRIGDFVWEDVNRNGLQDAGEPGIAGVSVSLGGSGCYAMSGQRTTDATGHYLLQWLSGTRCHLSFYPPALSHARYEPTISGVSQVYYDLVQDFYWQLAADDSDMGGTFFPNSTPEFMLPLRDSSGGDDWAERVDAGFVRWVNGGISGQVWNDRNRNGQREAGEASLPGVTVDLMVTLAQVGASVTTDPSGRFSFDDLRSDWNYLVRVVPPTGWLFTLTDVGNDLSDNDFSNEPMVAGLPALKGTLLFRLDSAEQRTSFGAGVYDPAAPVPEPATWGLWLVGLSALGARRLVRRGCGDGMARHCIAPTFGSLTGQGR